MKPPTVSRRDLLAAGGTTLLTAPAYSAPAPLTLRAIEPSGAPAGEAVLKLLLATNTDGRPFELLPQPKGDGAATLALPKDKFELMMPLAVRGFGDVYLYADNAGALYSAGQASGKELLLNYEFARSRDAFVRRYVKQAQAEGVNFTAEVTGRLERAGGALSKASAAREIAQRAAHSNDSLAESMWAGEIAALERARHHIRRRGPRPGFLFGCNAFQYHRSDEYARLYDALLNFATLPFYRARTEPVEGKHDFSQAEAILAKLAGTPLITKGHPLVWFHQAGTPAFLKTKSWPDLKESCRQFILTAVDRFRSRIHSWDVINEAHDWANDVNLSQDQFLEMTRLAAETTRAADPTAFRVVNSCCTWGEYVATRRTYTGTVLPASRTPYEYACACEDAKIPYEAVGLQIYYPRRDMLEIERQMERFFRLGKPIHLTELGVSSKSEPQVRGQETKTPSRGVWHGTEWTEQIQADWIEQFYTICYSKPQIEAITWWDFSDPAFIPHGGFLRPDLQPKEAYTRLQKLIRSWTAA